MASSSITFIGYDLPPRDGIFTEGDTPICFRVGERHFIALHDTLIRQSEYFAARYPNKQDYYDTVFIDTDPNIFEHIINFLRTGIYPLFFDVSTQTFDHAKYFPLLAESQRFGIKKLVDWIANKKYLSAVRITKSVIVLDDISSGHLQDYLNQGSPADGQVEVSTSWTMKNFYLCPRGIRLHNGDRSRCGRNCEVYRRRRGGRVEFEERRVLSAIITTTKISIDSEYCLNDAK
ncbi:hypothetical protein GGS26DRAFT_593148 [Hypomontagnella submonticulosa]|nr:hypothetical protein GGS26DRAFT_593148 [Hypomontagnella submonticulosa]